MVVNMQTWIGWAIVTAIFAVIFWWSAIAEFLGTLDRYWREKSNGDPPAEQSSRSAKRPAKRKPIPRPGVLTPCDHCGAVEGELLYCGWWVGDGLHEGLHVGEEIPLVLCRHCREVAEARVVELLESRVLAG